MAVVEYEYDRFELFIIWKLVYHRWWCDKHLNRRDAVKGAPDRRYDLADEAIDQLVRKKLVQSLKKQGRDDICVSKYLKNYFEKLLHEYQGKDGFEFIRGLEYIR
jgi:hypothetical protein